MCPERFTAAVMTKLRLSLNEAKTSIRDARKERFEFLGYSFGPHYWWKNGQRYMGASQSKKSVQWIKAKISKLLVSGGAAPHGSLLAMCLQNWRSRSYARAQWTPAVGRTVTPVGKPDAGNQHVRFDERGANGAYSSEHSHRARFYSSRPKQNRHRLCIMLVAGIKSKFWEANFAPTSGWRENLINQLIVFRFEWIDEHNALQRETILQVFSK
jgi:hypothetical protein